MRSDTEGSPVSFLAHVKRLPSAGLQVLIEADEAQRAALASDHGLESVESFRAELLVTAWKRNGVKVSGRVRAKITQSCIVTLDPLPAVIDAEVDGLFLAEDSKLGRLGFDTAGEIVIDVDGPDSPETFAGDTIDVGAYAEEFFGLAIDPYPRKTGAALSGSEPAGQPLGQLGEKLRGLLPKS